MWEKQILRWCLKDPTLRTQILRFIDCLPSLKTSREIVLHLRDYFPSAGSADRLAQSPALPLPLQVGLAAARPGLLTDGAVAAVTRATCSAIARLFLAGANLEEALGNLARLEERGIKTSIDLLGESTTSEAEAEHYRDRCLELIREWPKQLKSAPHLSLKLSSLAFPFDPVDPDGAYRRIRPRLGAILRAAASAGGFVNVDMEQYHLRNMVLSLTLRLLEDDFPRESNVGVVIQSYLTDAEETLERVIQWASARKQPITIRLVRGAYWDSEVIWARQRNWPCPVYLTKTETDSSYDRLLEILLENHDRIRTAVATHNLRSIDRAVTLARNLKVPQERWETQVLYGMGEAVQEAVRGVGVPVRVYAPVGELIPGMAYLVRRLLENTSQSSFIANELLR